MRRLLLLLSCAASALAGDGAPVNGLLISVKAPRRVVVGQPWKVSATFENTSDEPLRYHTSPYARRVRFPSWKIVGPGGDAFKPHVAPFSSKWSAGLRGEVLSLAAEESRVHPAEFHRACKDAGNRWGMAWCVLPPGRYRLRCIYSRSPKILAKYGADPATIRTLWQGRAVSDEVTVEVVPPTKPYALLELPDGIRRTGKGLGGRLRISNPTKVAIVLKGDLELTIRHYSKSPSARVGTWKRTIDPITVPAGETTRLSFPLSGVRIAGAPSDVFQIAPQKQFWVSIKVRLGALAPLDDGAVRLVDADPKK